jgi:hypothetical protein
MQASAWNGQARQADLPRLVSSLANIWSEQGLKVVKRRVPLEKSRDRSVCVARESYETRQ